MPRIGLLVPSSNTSVETEFHRALPDEVTLHVGRLFLTQVTPESVRRIVEDMEGQAKLLASADVDLIVLGATLPSLLNGLGYDQQLIGKIEAATDRRATTTTTALVKGLHRIGARRVVMGAAYDDTMNGVARSFLQASGFEVLDAAALGLVDNLRIGRLSSETAYELGCRIARPDADAIVLACTNWLTLDVIERIESTTGMPVITTTQATLWAALGMLGVTPRAGYGRLMRLSLEPASTAASS
jgi:maleate cis-trans isomerase